MLASPPPEYRAARDGNCRTASFQETLRPRPKVGSNLREQSEPHRASFQGEDQVRAATGDLHGASTSNHLWKLVVMHLSHSADPPLQVS